MNASNVWFKNRQFLKDYYYSVNFKEMKDIKVNHWFALSALFHVKALTVDVLFLMEYTIISSCIEDGSSILLNSKLHFT